jgi:hypothetical protein
LIIGRDNSLLQRTGRTSSNGSGRISMVRDGHVGKFSMIRLKERDRCYSRPVTQ